MSYLKRAQSSLRKSSPVIATTKHEFKQRPLIICGPSGVGKGTITDLLLKEHGEMFGKSVSHTTRGQRPGEVHGRDYFFVKDASNMKRSIEKGDFLEHAVVHSNLYGTSFETLSNIEATNRVCVLDIDVFGLRQIIGATEPGSLNRVGILPNTMDELEKRLRGRGTESEASVLKRLHAAKEEVRSIREDGIVDAIIENRNSWEYGYPALLRLLRDWYPHLML